MNSLSSLLLRWLGGAKGTPVRTLKISYKTTNLCQEMVSWSQIICEVILCLLLRMNNFLFTEEGTRVISCPAGNAPKSCSYIKQTGQCRISFSRNKCENCPHRDHCQPKMFNRTSVLFLSKRSSDRAKSQRAMKTEQFKALARIRNGVETIPSILRRKY